MGCCPESPIINHLLSSLKNINTKDWRLRSGVFFFSNTLMQFIEDAPGINITFPTTVFYALPFGTHLAIEHYLKPWSLAIHYWAQTQNHDWKK